MKQKFNWSGYGREIWERNLNMENVVNMLQKQMRSFHNRKYYEDIIIDHQVSIELNEGNLCWKFNIKALIYAHLKNEYIKMCISSYYGWYYCSLQNYFEALENS